MFRKSVFVLAFIAIAAVLASGCYYDKEELLYPGGGPDCNGAANKFVDVNPIVQTKCAFSPSCHAVGSTNIGGPLTNYTQIKNKAQSIKLQVQTGLMPQTGSLTAAEKQSIICWIEAGAPNN
jgi:uncharacterized membrane protein